MKLREKVVLVTGAASGLGAATALACARDGANVLLVDRDAESLEVVQAEVRKAGVRGENFVCDLSERQSCFDAVAAAMVKFGRLDGLCNVAGIMQFHHVCDVLPEDWNRLLAVNLSAPFYLSQAAIPELIKTHGGIVNVASSGGIKGAAYSVPYSITKAGLIQMTKGMAMEFIKEPIRINVLAPGAMDTNMNANLLREGAVPQDLDRSLIARYAPLRPMADPMEMANMIAYMLSDSSPAMHGAVIAIDAGITAG